jgi:ComF family protein
MKEFSSAMPRGPFRHIEPLVWRRYAGLMEGGVSAPIGCAQPDRLGRLAGALRATFGRLLDVALPQLCASCRDPITTEGLCAVCWSNLSFIAPPYCERLGIPFPYDPGPGVISIEAIADPPAYRRARAVVRYGEVSSRLVHALKYGDRLDLAPLMGRWMATAGRDLLAEADAMVPVPLHWRRHWARRFNQSEALAGVIAKASGVSVARSALKRVKATPQQVGLSQSERALNVQGAFRVPSSGSVEVIGRRLLLVDDVLTTGSTLDACARTLLRAGAAQVDVLVFARVVAAVRPPI